MCSLRHAAVVHQIADRVLVVAQRPERRAGRGSSVVIAPGEAEILVGQDLVHRRARQVAVREVVVAVERQDHVRAVEDVTLRASFAVPVTVGRSDY